MSEKIELLIENIGQLCTVPAHEGGPQRGEALGDLGIVEGAALAVADGQIVAVGPSAELSARYRAAQRIDAGGRLVTPGLVDPHTHAVWAGDRAEEFAQRIAGATYQEIMAAGGGINRTMRDTRAAGLSALVEQSKRRLDAMLAPGTTTVEDLVRAEPFVIVRGELRRRNGTTNVIAQDFGRLPVTRSVTAPSVHNFA